MNTLKDFDKNNVLTRETTYEDMKAINKKRWEIYSKWEKMLQKAGVFVNRKEIRFPFHVETENKIEVMFATCKLIMTKKYVVALQVMEDAPPKYIKGDIITQGQLQNFIICATLVNDIFIHLKKQKDAGNNSQKKDDHSNQDSGRKVHLHGCKSTKDIASHV